METIRGKTCMELDADALKQLLAGRERVVLDLGTGDGRYVRHLAERHPGWFVVGVDACRENLREHSRAQASNALFVIASAQDLPRELRGLASQVTINFPWGSLLEALLSQDARLMSGLASLAGGRGSMELRLNAGALAEAGRGLEAGSAEVLRSLTSAGWQMVPPRLLDVSELRTFPSTWARRLAYGRDPRAMLLSGVLNHPNLCLP